MLAMIESYALNRARWDTLVFFGNNPSAESRAEVLAQKSGQSARVLQHELDDLMDMGILRLSQIGNQKVYALVVEPSVRNAVICFAQFPIARVSRPSP